MQIEYWIIPWSHTDYHSNSHKLLFESDLVSQTMCMYKSWIITNQSWGKLIKNNTLPESNRHRSGSKESQWCYNVEEGQLVRVVNLWNGRHEWSVQIKVLIACSAALSTPGRWHITVMPWHCHSWVAKYWMLMWWECVVGLCTLIITIIDMFSL